MVVCQILLYVHRSLWSFAEPCINIILGSGSFAHSLNNVKAIFQVNQNMLITTAVYIPCVSTTAGFGLCLRL